jgi:urease accessory protein
VNAPLDVRLARDIGRSARADVAFAARGDRTTVVHSYAEPPFRTVRGFPEDTGLHAILTSSAPGIFGGDSLSQTIVVDRGARVRLTSQSALQVHPSPDGQTAQLTSSYRVAAGAALFCAWDPAIPFPGARLEQRISIDLAGDATLVWSDAVMSGRVARGERWRFAGLSHELRVMRRGSLRYLERHRIRPGAEALDRDWVGGGANYFGTVLAAGVRVDSGAAEMLHHALNAIVGMRAAVDVLEEGMVLVRLAAASGPAFHQARAAAYASAVSWA